RIRNLPALVPRLPERRERGPRFGVEPARIMLEERGELHPVRALLLRIDVPHERTRGPLRAHERILATDEIHVASPEELVIAILRKERNDEGLHVAATLAARDLAGGFERGGGVSLRCHDPDRHRQ